MNIKILSRCLYPVKFKCDGMQVIAAGMCHQKRNASKWDPKLRFPYWYLKQERVKYDECLTEENKDFIDKMVNDTYENVLSAESKLSPLRIEPTPKGTWFPGCKRSGLIGIKLGFIPQWLKDGKRITATLVQVIDNHVINYVPPGERPELRRYAAKMSAFKHLGQLVVGAINCDPQRFTKEYCGLFNKAGVMPKKILTKFYVHPESIIQPGTPLYAAHFKAGDLVDVTGKTVYRGFQGVMKRWGFHGMPASHGQTKTHRRPGSIGGGGQTGRVWPGTKMPGHVGYKTRSVRSLTVLRINHKYNVLYISGIVPGPINGIVYVHDAFASNLTVQNPPRFPTYYPEDNAEELPEEEYCDGLFNFNDPTIEYSDKVKKIKLR